MTSFQSYDVMLHTMLPAVPENMDPQPGQIRLYIFIRLKLWGAFTLQSRLNLILPPVRFGFFPPSKLKERLAGRKFTRVQDISKAIRHFKA